MGTLTKNDYVSILNYYNIEMNKDMSSLEIKNKAESILASKLCKCIKKVDTKSGSESRAIAICRDAVIQKKGLDIFSFTCKNKAKLIPKKNTKINLIKTKSKTKKNKRSSKKLKKINL
jgi:hypothetical protein